MAKGILKRIFGSKNDRTLKQYKNIVSSIDSVDAELNLSTISDSLLNDIIMDFKEKSLISNDSLDDLLPKAFALCREVSSRKMGMRHYDVQLIGGAVLNGNNIAEMKTGEGKTLVATLPAYLNTLKGKQVHVVTVNDYLAMRDAELMRPVYEGLGVTVSYLQGSMSEEERRSVYQNNDIVYGTNSEFAFDYLRDNMAASKESMLQKELSYALIDEVDSILIDEARTPLIISGRGDLDLETIEMIYDIAKEMKVEIHSEEKKEHEDESNYNIDAFLFEKNKGIRMLESGHDKFEKLLLERNVLKDPSDLYTVKFLHVFGMLTTTLKAIHLYNNQVDYLIDNGEIKIINQQTGRVDTGKRWSDGLHQAVEVKEGVEVLPDNQALASISLQNFYRIYDKISGMTGTADTEAFEFNEVYGLDVVVIPPHKQLLRIDYSDVVFMTKAPKYKAIIKDIKKNNDLGRPVLVGTESVEESEYLSSLLDKDGLHHNVLNAKNHAQEAAIISQAGRAGSITIATNMAGRGTDIILGGNASELSNSLVTQDQESIDAIYDSCKEQNKRVKELGGLHVIGTSRHDSRRVDNQLKGRAGRQGDPGSSIFYVSFEDELIRVFASSGAISMIKRLGLNENDSISHSSIDKGIARAQISVENHHYNTRKELLKYDDLNNMQRKEVYSMRREILFSDDLTGMTKKLLHDGLDVVIQRHLPQGSFLEEWDTVGAEDYLNFKWGMSVEIVKRTNESKYFEENDTYNYLHNELDKTIGELIGQFSDQSFREFSRSSMLSVIDEHWKDQIEDLDTLRGGIHLRGFAQKNPVQEYGRESMEMFVAMVESIKESFSLQLISTLKEVISRSGKEIGEDQVLAFREELESEQEIEQETERTGIKYVTHLYRQEKIKRENAI